MGFSQVYLHLAVSAALRSAALSILGAVLLLVPLVCHSQADYAREQRWAGEIAPGIVVGETLYLELKSGRRFLALYAPHPKATAGVIVVHGMGVHPDWGLINPLRSGLSKQGYSTLSVQMPVLAADARGDQYPPLFPEAAERLAAAVAFLRGKAMAKIAIVSHSMGARMANYYFNVVSNPGIGAWVAIGLSGAYTEPATIGVPVLDLFGEKDLPAVLAGAKQRAAGLRGLRGSAQIEVPGADHFFCRARDRAHPAGASLPRPEVEMTCSDLWHRRSPQCRIVPDGSEQASSQEAVPVCAKGEACTMHVVPDKIAAATAEGGLLYRHTAVDTAGERWMLHCTIEALVV